MPDEILIDPSFFTLCCGFLGLIVGSFLNVLIIRLPIILRQNWREECNDILDKPLMVEVPLTLSNPPSTCPGCKKRISPMHNIPVLSWLLLKTQCAYCGMAISARYPMIELLTCLLSAAVGYQFGFGLEALGGLILIWILIALAGIDIDTQLLPDNLTLPLLWIGLSFNLLDIWTSLESAVLGAMTGYCSLFSIYWIFKWCTGKEGMGYGDFKLLSGLGAWFGWQFLPLLLLISSCLGIMTSVLIIIKLNLNKDTPLPFGPYLAAAGMITLFAGDRLMEIYMGSFLS